MKTISAREWMKQTGETETELKAEVTPEMYSHIMSLMDEFGEACIETSQPKQGITENEFVRRMSAVHSPSDPLPDGCYCKPGQCMAPVIMGRQMPCRDPEKAQGKQRCCDNGYFGEPHECQKSNPETTVDCIKCSRPIPFKQGTCPHCGYKEF